MSLLLVLAAAVALVIGLLQSGLAIIYVSIGCSVVAGLLLAVAVVRGRPERVSTGPMGQPAPQPAPVSQSWQSPEPVREPAASEREPVMAGAGGPSGGGSLSDSTQQLDQAAIEQAVHGDADEGPIPDYDRLRATEVLPLLANLDADELAQVRTQEAAGRNRFMVLSRIDRELEARGPADGADGEEPDGSQDAAPSDWGADDEWDRSAETGAEDEDEADERPPLAMPASSRGASGSILDNYEQLKVLEILPRLGDLDADELAQVRRREQAGQRRAMIINRVDRLIVQARPARSATPPARPTSGAPARRGPAKRGPAKKAAATRAPAKKAPAKRVAVKKAAPKKAPVAKAAAKRAPAKKAARTPTPTQKRVGAVRKTSKATKKR